MMQPKEIPDGYSEFFSVDPIPLGTDEWLEKNPDSENRPGWHAYEPDPKRVDDPKYTRWGLRRCLPTYGMPGTGPGGYGFVKSFDLPGAIEAAVENIKVFPRSEERELLLAGLNGLREAVSTGQTRND